MKLEKEVEGKLGFERLRETWGAFLCLLHCQIAIWLGARLTLPSLRTLRSVSIVFTVASVSKSEAREGQG